MFKERLLVPRERILKLEEKWVERKEKSGLGYKISDFALAESFLLVMGGLASSNLGASDKEFFRSWCVSRFSDRV